MSQSFRFDFKCGTTYPYFQGRIIANSDEHTVSCYVHLSDIGLMDMILAFLLKIEIILEKTTLRSANVETVLILLCHRNILIRT